MNKMMNKNINKKGEVYISKVFLIIGYTILSSILVIFILFFFNQFRSTYAEVPPGLEKQLTLQYLMTAPECFLYQDPYTNANRLLAYDAEKLTQEQLQKCIKNKDYQFRLGFSSDADTFPSYEISTESFNPRKFAEAVELYPDVSYFVKYNNNFHKAKVSIEVQT